MGWPMCARWARIWCVLPVTGWHSTRLVLPSFECPSSLTSVRAGRNIRCSWCFAAFSWYNATRSCLGSLSFFTLLVCRWCWCLDALASAASAASEASAGSVPVPLPVSSWSSSLPCEALSCFRRPSGAFKGSSAAMMSTPSMPMSALPWPKS